MISKTRTASPTNFPRITVTGYRTSLVGEEMETALAQFADAPADNISVSGGASEIEYENGRQRFNYCLHEYDSFSHDQDLCDEPYAVCWYNEPDKTYYTATWRGGPEPSLPSIPPELSVSGEMRRRAWQAIYPEINNGLSLAVTIFEFKDFSRLMSTARKTHKLFAAYISGSKKRTSPGRMLSDLFLSYSFGIQPIVRDIKGIASDLMHLQKVVNEFRDRGRKPENYHYKEVLQDEVSYDSTADHAIIKSQVKATYYATCKLSYEYDVPDFWDALLRVGGLRITPATVWEIIPWSFVMDWLVNIQQFLEQFDKDPRVTVLVRDYCDTIKSVSKKTAYRTNIKDGYSAWLPSDPIPGMMPIGTVIPYPTGEDSDPLWTWRRVRYERSPGEPDMGYALPVFDFLSNRQLVLAGALLRAQYR